MTSAEYHFTDWHKSSYSTSGQNCVEVAPGWHKSSHSSAGNNCVEVTAGTQVVGVRDSKNPDGAPLAISPLGWSAFITTLKSTSVTR